MQKNILIIEPYFTGSHKQWALGYAKQSSHKITLLHLPGRYWKWRMHGGAVTLAREFLKQNLKPDIILATDMLDLTTFLALTRKQTANTPTAIYFHENQLTYPWSPTDRDVAKNRDGHYSFINFSSTLSADKVLFNSKYHMNTFLSCLPNFLKHFPDNNELSSIQQIREKSEVLPLGLNLEKLDTNQYKDIKKSNKLPLILWNHRWEYDKNPQMFFDALNCIAEKGLNFEIAIVGENFSNKPDEFKKAKKKLDNRIIQFGYEKDFNEYAKWLWQADIMPVTSIHDFFGAGVVEGMYCNCFPILPNRLAYPEHLPLNNKKNYYNSFNDLIKKLEWAISNIDEIRKLKFNHFVKKYDWKDLCLKYDLLFTTSNFVINRTG